MRKLKLADIKIGTKFIMLDDTIVYTIEYLDDLDAALKYAHVRWTYKEQQEWFSKYYIYSFEVLENLAYIVEFNG